VQESQAEVEDGVADELLAAQQWDIGETLVDELKINQTK
jgi:hypothetical protein